MHLSASNENLHDDFLLQLQLTLYISKICLCSS